ncbi:hypothetical protein I317_03021 [Kwoniella heveanensis CBS 569]|nr:hypothetical protein I317_03021 [Kwoniella heveanensis CBS 569]
MTSSMSGLTSSSDLDNFQLQHVQPMPPSLNHFGSSEAQLQQPQQSRIPEDNSGDTMDLETEEGMVWEPEHAPAKPVHYLAVDTNVFISHLNLIRAIHALLAELKPSPLVLLVPSVVIHELDGLTKSRVQESPNSPATVGMTARAGNRWLLEANRNRRATGYGALRCQALNERWDADVRAIGKGDDQVLDCCLYFAHHGARVSLWTEDQNLSLKAESNDVPTFGDKDMTLHRFFSITGDEYPEKLWHEVQALEGHPHDHDHDIPYPVSENSEKQVGHGDHLDMDMEMDGGMELDVDLTQHGSRTPYHPIEDLVNDPAYVAALASRPQQAIEDRRYPYLLPPKVEPQLQQEQVSVMTLTPTLPAHALRCTATSPGIMPTHPSMEIEALSVPTGPSTDKPNSPASTVMSFMMPDRTSPSNGTNTPVLSTSSPFADPQTRLSHQTDSNTTLMTRTTPTTRSTTPITTPMRTTTPLTNTRTNANTDTNLILPRACPPRKNDNRPSNILLTSLQLALKPYTLSLISSCPPLPPLSTASTIPMPTPPTSTLDILPALLSALVYLDTIFSKAGEPGNSETRLDLLKAISAAKTIKCFVDYHASTRNETGLSDDLDIKYIIARGNGKGYGLPDGARRIRSGEVIDALCDLTRIWTNLGIGPEGGDEGVIADVIEDLRRLA